MPLLEFPEPKSLNVLEIGDNKDHRTMVYSVENPHPGYGKDPNILNELGHSVYPKMVYPNGKERPGVLVKDNKEEDEVMNSTLKADGPTIQQYVEAGYKASEYPPKGYSSKSTEAEIKEWVDKENAAKAAAAGAWG